MMKGARASRRAALGRDTMTMHTQDTNLHAVGTAITGVSLDTWWINQNILVDSENGYGFRGTGDLCTLINNGTLWSETNFGVRYEGTKGHVFNSFLGTIGGHGGISLSPGTQLVNSGRIISTSNSGGAAGIEVIAGADSLTRIENSGTVSGEVALLALAWVSLHNTGDVFGHIDLGAAPDVIRNAGTILGDVGLGGGADLYDGRGGLVQGVIDGGGGSDTIIGGVEADFLVGGRGRDIVRGDGGDDTLVGCYGRDVLNGGAGADTFVFANLRQADRITDFTTSEDLIHLEDNALKGMSTKGGLAASAFHVGPAATSDDHRVIYDEETGNLYYDRNGDAQGGVTKIARLSPGLDLSHQHFEII
jgi:Ca2+-binding RTX toxin-like protein